MNRLEKREDGLFVSSPKKFEPITAFKATTVEQVFEFAFAMSFGREGQHRHQRSGGSHRRRNGEIFANAFQGKLSEFAICNCFYKEFKMNTPDLSVYGLGQWDDFDFKINGKTIAVKSTKSYGNLLLLETADWNRRGNYIPSNDGKGKYCFYILVRMKPFCEEIMRNNRWLYTDEIDKEELRKAILAESWEYDIPGYVDRRQIKFIIKNIYIIKKGDKLNGKTTMDADNYYIQAGDLKPIEEMSKLLKKKFLWWGIIP